MSLADAEAAETPALATAAPFALSQLADIRQRHQERYREREEQEEQDRVAKAKEQEDGWELRGLEEVEVPEFDGAATVGRLLAAVSLGLAALF